MLRSYIRLMRFNKPIGIILLITPVLWSLWLAGAGKVDFKIVFLFSMGSIIMRTAGCIINDIADRHFDLKVDRTKKRPLANGEINVVNAFILFCFLGLIALLIVLELPFICFGYAILAVMVTIIYPFCKRYIEMPQLVLGVTFSMGIPMAFAALNKAFYPDGFILFILNFLWILAYDTQYAMADKKDDLLIGVKSTAIFWGQYDIKIIKILQILFHCGWFLFFSKINHILYFMIGWATGGVILFWQQKRLTYCNNSGNPKECIKVFNSNGYYGVAMLLTLLGSTL